MLLNTLRRLSDATCYSWQGLQALWQSAFAFRLEMMVLLILMPVIYWLDVSFPVQLLMLVLLWLLPIVEAINSAIETTINRISQDRHPLSKQAKDIGSAAVFLTVILNVFVWLIVLMNV